MSNHIKTTMILVVLLCASSFAELFESYKLFEENFEKKADAAWQVKSGDWAGQGGKYFQQDKQADGLCVLAGKQWGDMIARFKLQLVSGETAKLYFGYTEDSHYVVELNRDKTRSSLKYVRGGQETVLSAIDFGMDDDFHFVMVQAIDDRITIWIDSRNRVETIVKTPHAGTIALGTQNAVAWFDDVVVYQATMD